MKRPVRPVALVILTLRPLYPGLTSVFQGLYPWVARQEFALVAQQCAFVDLALRFGLRIWLPPSAIEKLAEMGLLGMNILEEWGGLGYDARPVVTVIEEIARVSAALAIMVGVHNTVGAYPIYAYGADEQRRKYLPRLTTGAVGAFSLSEPGAGSDASSLTTTARRDGDHYVLNGEKNWVTNGRHVWTFLVFARTGGPGPKGISGFIGEKETPGLP